MPTPLIPVEAVAASVDVEVIATDLDGTFLNQEHVPSVGSLSAAAAALAGGKRLVLATGRGHHSAMEVLKPYFSAMGVDFLPGVFMNGLQVFGCGGIDDVVFESVMPSQLVSQTCNTWDRACIESGLFSTDTPCPVHVFAQSATYVSRPCAFMAEVMELYGEKAPVVEPRLFERIASGEILALKLGLWAKTATAAKQLRSAVEQALNGMGMNIVQGIDVLLEVMPADHSKATGLEKLLAHMKSDPSQLMTLGDSENDIEMLRMTKHSVAMGNARMDLSHHASYKTRGNHEEGFAHALQHLLGITGEAAVGG